MVLAAAVSDFYIPRSAMAVDKIQSAAAPLGPGASSEGGMDLSLSAVPKMLGRIKNEWCPEAMVRTAFCFRGHCHVFLLILLSCATSRTQLVL